jgi:hypothetical protein
MIKRIAHMCGRFVSGHVYQRPLPFAVR